MYKNVLVPVALDHEHDVGVSMDIARKLLDEGGKIIAVHVIEAIPQFAAVHLPVNFQEKQRSEFMASLKAELDGDGAVTADVVTGHAGRTILDYAQRHDCDCVIVASHRPGFKDHFLGSTAAWVVRHSNCSVHVIR